MATVASVRDLRRRLPRPPFRWTLLRPARRQGRPQGGAGRHDPADGRGLDRDRPAADIRGDRVPAPVFLVILRLLRLGAGAEQAGSTYSWPSTRPCVVAASSRPSVRRHPGGDPARGRRLGLITLLPEEALLSGAGASRSSPPCAHPRRPVHPRAAPPDADVHRARAHDEIAERPVRESSPRACQASSSASACAWPRTAARTCSNLALTFFIATVGQNADRSLLTLGVTLGSLIGIFSSSPARSATGSVVVRSTASARCSCCCTRYRPGGSSRSATTGRDRRHRGRHRRRRRLDARSPVSDASPSCSATATVPRCRDGARALRGHRRRPGRRARRLPHRGEQRQLAPAGDLHVVLALIATASTFLVPETLRRDLTRLDDAVKVSSRESGEDVDATTLTIRAVQW